MKRHLFLAIVFAIVSLTFGCTRSQTSEHGAPQAEATPSQSPTSLPTPDQKAITLNILKEYWQKVQEQAASVDDWQDETAGANVKFKQVCRAWDEFDTIRSVVYQYRDHNPGVSANDFGATDEKINSLLRDRTVAFVKALATVPNGMPEGYDCTNRFYNGWEVVESMTDSLRFAQLQPIDADLTAGNIKAKRTAALRQRVSAWRKDGDGICDILEGADGYHFTAAELGLSESELKKIREDGCHG